MAVAHPEQYRLVTDYDAIAARRMTFVVAALLLWLVPLIFVVFTTGGHPPGAFVLLWFDVFAAVGFGGTALLLPPWHRLKRLLKSARTKCQVCDLDFTAGEEYEHVRAVHRRLHRIRVVVQMSLYLVGSLPFGLIFLAFQFTALDMWTTGQFWTIAWGASIGFLAAVVLFAVWLRFLGPRSLERIRREWKGGQSPGR